ncbi:MAG: extracellular solute-binding protein [Phycisphaeraceae bacterium]|nr:extracellular solute-binding protein [Phycisphaeraceae bacterium]
MKDWIPRLIVIALLLVVVVVPMAFRASPQSAGHAGTETASERLIIITPHNEQIRYEFARAFNQWRRAQRPDAPWVEIDWRTGGTSELSRQVASESVASARRGTLDSGTYDLFFGGGAFEHTRLARGVPVRLDGREEAVRIIDFPDLSTDGRTHEEVLREAFAFQYLAGEPLYLTNDEGRVLWIGTALSSFGVVYNNDALKMLGWGDGAPTTWSDLADPRLRQWVALADPAHSGSIRQTYNVILRRMGWNEGWAMLRRSFANARYFTADAGKVPIDVSQMEAAAGMCIDFFGRQQVGAVAEGRLGYVDPARMTAITADPITLMRGAPNRELAVEFIRFTISAEGQRLWQRKRGVEGGPHQFELRRMPIRYDLFRRPAPNAEPDYTRDPVNQAERDLWTDPEIDAWALASEVPAGMPDWFGVVPTIVHAMAIDIHDDLQRAWATIQRETDPQRRAAMLELFDAMPPELFMDLGPMRDDWPAILSDAEHPDHKELVDAKREFLASIRTPWRLDADQELHDRIRWTLFFRDNYRRIIRMGRGG